MECFRSESEEDSLEGEISHESDEDIPDIERLLINHSCHSILVSI